MLSFFLAIMYSDFLIMFNTSKYSNIFDFDLAGKLNQILKIYNQYSFLENQIIYET